MKPKLLLLFMALTTLGGVKCYADYNLYAYDKSAGAVAAGSGTVFVETVTSGVYKISGFAVPSANMEYYVLTDNAWTTYWGSDASWTGITATGTAVQMTANETCPGAVWSNLAAGTYDVTFNFNDKTIQFDTHSSEGENYPLSVDVYCYRNESSINIGSIPATDQPNGLFGGQLFLGANEQFWIIAAYDTDDDTAADTWKTLYTNSSNTMQEFVDNTTYNFWGSVTAGIHDFSFNFAAVSNAWSCTYNASASTATVNMTSAGYATFYSDFSYVMPTGLTGYTISPASNDGTLTLTESYAAGAQVPRWTGVLLKGNKGEYTITYNGDLTAANTNRIGGSHTAKTINTWTGDDNKNVLLYKLANNNTHGLGWYFDSANGQSLNCGANRGYLWLTQTEAGYSTSGARGFIPLDGEDGTTGIDQVMKKTVADDVYYNFQGQRVENPTKGLYIVNGKKVIIK